MMPTTEWSVVSRRNTPLWSDGCWERGRLKQPLAIASSAAWAIMSTTTPSSVLFAETSIVNGNSLGLDLSIVRVTIETRQWSTYRCGFQKSTYPSLHSEIVVANPPFWSWPYRLQYVPRWKSDHVEKGGAFHWLHCKILSILLLARRQYRRQNTYNGTFSPHSELAPSISSVLLAPLELSLSTRT